MNLPLFIAFRYFRARRSRHIINWISRISVAGITLGTMTLIIVLSVFNGLDHLIRSLFSSFDPDIKITAVEGKTFLADSVLLSRVGAVPGVADYCQVLEENALLKYRDRQAIATLKGVDPKFSKVSGIDALLVDGEVRFSADDTPMGVIGQGLAGELGVGLNFINPIHVYVPKRSGRILLNPLQSINHRYLFPSGVFAVQQEYDSKYLIVPLSFARDFFDYSGNEVSALEVSVTDARMLPSAIKELSLVFGKDFKISDRLGQHADFYRVMSGEKLAIFLILGFILMVASFNTISSLTLLMLEKKADMQILRGMGASQIKIRQVFLWEGLLVTGIGMLIGLILGAVVCLIQQQFGIIRFPNAGSFVVNVYPVRMLISDFLLVTLLVSLIGYFAAWVPLRVMKKRYFETESVDE
jgi:lipoprotein-releasing system permease protein